MPVGDTPSKVSNKPAGAGRREKSVVSGMAGPDRRQAPAGKKQKKRAAVISCRPAARARPPYNRPSFHQPPPPSWPTPPTPRSTPTPPPKPRKRKTKPSKRTSPRARPRKRRRNRFSKDIKEPAASDAAGSFYWRCWARKSRKGWMAGEFKSHKSGFSKIFWPPFL